MPGTKNLVQPVSDSKAMIAGMAPVLDDAVYCFCTFEDTRDIGKVLEQALASFREDEGLSVILTTDVAVRLGLTPALPMRRITLNVYSSLEGIGLTAAVASALTDAGVSCNMVAAYHHDHVFVPAADAEKSLAVLLQLAADAA